MEASPRDRAPTTSPDASLVFIADSSSPTINYCERHYSRNQPSSLSPFPSAQVRQNPIVPLPFSLHLRSSVSFYLAFRPDKRSIFTGNLFRRPSTHRGSSRTLPQQKTGFQNPPFLPPCLRYPPPTRLAKRCCRKYPHQDLSGALRMSTVPGAPAASRTSTVVVNAGAGDCSALTSPRRTL